MHKFHPKTEILLEIKIMGNIVLFCIKVSNKFFCIVNLNFLWCERLIIMSFPKFLWILKVNFKYGTSI